MSHFPIAFLAWRNFSRNISRYRVLLSAIILASAVFVFVLGTVNGMTSTLRSKAARYFSGDISVQQFIEGGHSELQEPEKVRLILEQLAPPNSVVIMRSLHYRQTAEVFFAGQSIRQRRVIGVDWEQERPVLERMSFDDGNVPMQADEVLLSSQTAERLGARLGDSVVVRMRTLSGQVNTAVLVVRGIYRESSFFGYSVYMEREHLNRLEGAEPGRVNEAGVFLLGRGLGSQRQLAAQIQQKLAALGATFPVIQNRTQRSRLLAERRPEPHYAVLALDALLAEIKDLLNAIAVVAWLVLILFAGLIVVGVANTYSMIVYERTREIGTLRALGMLKERVLAVLLGESMFLGLLGALLGTLLGVAILQGIKFAFDFSSTSWGALFLQQGHLEWKLTITSYVTVLLLAVLAALGGCARAAWKASRLVPVEALRLE